MAMGPEDHEWDNVKRWPRRDPRRWRMNTDPVGSKIQQGPALGVCQGQVSDGHFYWALLCTLLRETKELFLVQETV
jgi:hypothetical protein